MQAREKKTRDLAQIIFLIGFNLMSHKLVSVIMPTFNRAHLVVEAIKSVQSQTYPAMQIIVIDDGSQDDTAQRVAEFENVEYHYQENKGQAAARNLGLKYAKGEYIASLDSDDRWKPNFLEVSVAALEKYETDFVFLNWLEASDSEQMGSGWERSREWQDFFSHRDGEWSILKPEEVRKLFVKTCPAPSSGLLIRRSSFVSNWNEKMKIADDWFLILEIVLSKPRRAAFTLSVYWTKHIHSTNIYHGREKLEVLHDLGLHDEAIFISHFDKQLTAPEKILMRRRLATHHFNIGRLNWQREGFSAAAFRSIARAFKIAPLGSSIYIARLTFHHLRNRYRIARGKVKQTNGFAGK